MRELLGKDRASAFKQSNSPIYQFVTGKSGRCHFARENSMPGLGLEPVEAEVRI